MSLLESKNTFRPLEYPEAFGYWITHDAMVWHYSEVPLAQDILDYNNSDEEDKEVISSIMRLFTQNDIEVGGGYDTLLRIFKPTEVKMMLRSNADRESTHIAAYSLFTETLGFPDEFYVEYLEDETMKSKIDFVSDSQVKKYEKYEQEYKEDNTVVTNETLDEYIKRRFIQDVMYMLAVYASFTEGVSLFAQFAMLLKFQFLGKFKGLGQIVEWSIKDEEAHVTSNSWLFRQFVAENREYLTDSVKHRIYSAARSIVQKEEELVDKINPTHIDKEELKQYIRYIADQRLKLIGFKANYNVPENPLPFMEEVTGQVMTNFFEGKETGYTKNSLQGSWDDLKVNGTVIDQ